MNTIIIFIILSITIHGQMIGFTIDGRGLLTSTSNRMSISGISALAGLNIIEDLAVEGRIGYISIPLEYNGWDFSGIIMYKIKKPVYVLGIITSHFNNGIAEEGTLTKSIVLYGVGAGINITSFLNFEVIYEIPSKREPWIYHHNVHYTQFYNEKIVGIIKADFKFYWNL